VGDADLRGALTPIAVIDLGTNAVRLTIAEPLGDGDYRVLDFERETVRLGEGLYRTHRLGKAPMARALDALGRMQAIARGFGVGRLRAIATNAVREAQNGPAFCRAARRRHGLRLEVISAEREAELSYLSAARRFALGGEPVAIVDVGGGSVELVLARAGKVERLESLPLGAVRLTELHVKSDPLERRDWRALQDAIDRPIDAALGRRTRVRRMIGSGGTFTSLAQMAGRRNDELTPKEVDRLLDLLRKRSLEQRRRLPGVRKDRADIIVAGAAVVARLVQRLGVQHILVNDRGIRDGLLLSMLPRGRKRRRAPRGVLERAVSDPEHCAQVAALATALFDQLARPFDLPPHGRELVAAAARVHDVGLQVGYPQHHKHAYALITHAALPRLSRHQRELIGQLARYVRGSRPKKSHPAFAALDRPDRTLVKRLAGILRLADALDRTHSRRVTGVRCSVQRGRVGLQLRTRGDASVERWDARRRARLFEKAFGVKVYLTVKNSTGGGVT
jgi:exopolyphosphatase/guanosine-5'-triphosphate,3'-diphosphate pyrophosphatase